MRNIISIRSYLLKRNFCQRLSGFAREINPMCFSDERGVHERNSKEINKDFIVIKREKSKRNHH